jgi:signal transduction histidine kinase
MPSKDHSIKKINISGLLEKIAVLSISGEESSVDQILFEVLSLLMAQVSADIGQINLLPTGGRTEKLCIIKDSLPWLKKGQTLDFYDPSHGFTGMVIKSGKSLIIKNIWEKEIEGQPNPFLEITSTMSQKYLNEIKKPVASIIILPLKRDVDIFCTIELSRYRQKKSFACKEKQSLDDFAKKYGALIMEYVIDIRNRIALNTAQKKLLQMARLIASNRPLDYKDLIEPYTKLSSADIVVAFFKTGHITDARYRVVMWKGGEIREILLSDFVPSGESVLRDERDSIFPVEGEAGDKRLHRFQRRLDQLSGLSTEDRDFLLDGLSRVKSYVIYALHMLSQELGVIILGSLRPSFWQFLHMNSFLALYNSLLRSFLLNERIIQQLSDVSNKIHNPGFYMLGALKSAMISKTDPTHLKDDAAFKSLEGIHNLFIELHEQGKTLRWRKKSIYFVSWLRAFIHRKMAQLPYFKISLNLMDEHISEKRIMASDEQLETIFENLFSNSVRAITTFKIRDSSFIGRIDISIGLKEKTIEVIFTDNGEKYNTVSGRGIKQIEMEMKCLEGSMNINEKPYQTHLIFQIIDN